MPKCYCESHGCAGKLLKDRAFKDHQNEDTRRLLNQALNAADRAKKAEDDRLVAIVSELSLGGSDDATPGVLFAHSEDDIALTEPSVVSAGGTIPVSTESTFSDTLSRVKNDLRALTLRTKSQLESLSKPLKKSDPFPLTLALDEARELQGRTTRVLASGASVFSLKTQLTTDIATLVRQLDTARGSWKRQTERFKEPESLISRYSSDHHFAPILQGAEPLVQIMMFTMICLQVLLHLSRRGCHFLLAMTRFIIQLTLSRHKRELSSHDTQFVSQLPVDPASVTAKFPLDGQETIFAHSLEAQNVGQ
ncbi:hypothetical protein CPB83DRAFT_898736 [Crepidotus variabilis]|uniref:Uncharacterized protein n=1 Tax=Crepidotus variabilis TaxID=179855 RepID=A0A9P6E6Q2_9AGAR|nr:hypothetical protein CPB83DRAFT_898736 [Crepidotus variabilis]